MPLVNTVEELQELIATLNISVDSIDQLRELLLTVQQADLQAVGAEETLDLQLGFRPVVVGVTDDVVDRLVGRQHHRVSRGPVQSADLADRFEERPRRRLRLVVCGA